MTSLDDMMSAADPIGEAMYCLKSVQRQIDYAVSYGREQDALTIQNTINEAGTFIQEALKCFDISI